MCRKSICLFTVILVLGTAGNAWAELVGYWRLDEASGTIAYDSSGNGHDGTIKGDPQWVAGRNGTALDFDGTEDYIDIGLGAGDYFATLNSGLTVAAWISREGTGTYDIVFGAGRNPVGTTAGDDNNGWKFGIDSGDVIKFTTLGILDYTSSVGVPLGEWVHIAATFNEAGTEAQIYLNGNFEQAISGNGPANPATGLYAVGFGGTWALEFFDGMLDDVMIYNRVLSEAEVRYLAGERVQILVENFSFELPGTEKIKGWNGEGVADTPAVDVPGWSSDTVVADSGVESDWPGSTEGVWTGFMMGSDPSVWNLTSYVIGGGEKFRLLVDLQDNWTDGGAPQVLISLYYDDAGTRVTVASTTVTPLDQGEGGWSEFSLDFAADDVPDSVGKLIGIEIDNVSATDSWIGVDNVRLVLN